MPDDTPPKNMQNQSNQREHFWNNQEMILNAPIGIFMSTPEGRFLALNPALARMYGYESPEEVLGTITDIGRQLFFNPADREEFRKILESRGEVTNYEYRLRRRDGSAFWVSINARVVRDCDGNITHYHGFTTDIDARKQTEQKYQMLVENLNDIIYRIDDKATITYISPNIEFLGGYRTDEVIGRNFTEFVHPEDINGRIAQYQKVMSGIVEPSEYRFIDKEGRSIWVRTSARRIIEDGKVTGLQGVLTDITDLKSAEDALKESRRQLFTLITNLPGMVYRCKNDPDWTMEFISNGSRTLLGVEAQELAGNARSAYGFMIHPEDRARVQDTIQAALDQNRSFQMEYRIIAADGREKWVWEKGRGVPDTNGELTALEGFVTDISEQKRAEEKQNRLSEQLHQSRKMESIGRLAGGIAHDFNNMLTIINGYAEMMIDVLSPADPMYDKAYKIHDAGRRSTIIVRKLLAFARKQTISPEPMDLNDSISNMLSMLRRLIGENIEMLWRPADEIWTVKMDVSQIDQVLLNLVANARDSISDKGRIIMETGNIELDEDYCSLRRGFLPGQYVMLAVSDNGCGMAPEIQKNLFEPFFTTKEKGMGTGLGLATIYGIVKQNSGFINVYSEPNVGTTMKIYLPRHVDEAGRPIEKSAKQDHSRSGDGETILILEDDEVVLNITRIMLEKLNYTAVAAGSADQAMAAVKEREGRIDLLLSDVIMPDMNGFELASRLSTVHPHIRVLFMSGYTADVIARHNILKKGVHFIEKPFSLKTLSAKIREVLDPE